VNKETQNTDSRPNLAKLSTYTEWSHEFMNWVNVIDPGFSLPFADQIKNESVTQNLAIISI
jgi:hypothetical protein